MRLTLLSLTFFFFCCQQPAGQESGTDAGTPDSLQNSTAEVKEIMPAAWRFDEYLPLLEGKKVALTVNQTSMVGDTHLVDTLMSLGVEVVKVFAPEHGFRDMADAGEIIKNSTDEKTGLPIVSLYGSSKKPSPDQLKDIDVIIFDIQDVGIRFYTYISTMHYLMEAAAENDKTILVLDRPNPHGMYVAGPVLDMKYKSFVGMHPIPLVHGLTVGELAMMINGEGWLENGGQSNLKVITMENYDHTMTYSLPVKPSPNLPNDLSIALYPSLGLFEGTVLSIGRGTDAPFQQIGHPELKQYEYSFTPKSTEGAKNPPFKDQTVYGINLQDEEPNYEFTLQYIIEMYEAFPEKDKFFNNYFEKLIGDSTVRVKIKNRVIEEEIKQTWEAELNKYKEKRKKYLLYKDFE